MTAASGLIIVDKPSGWTSHDVVARVRRLAGTRRVGHAGTLDPMATGVLVVGVEKATRLLGHLALTDKEYLATIRLGQATDTGDAEGIVTAAAAASGLSTVAVEAAASALTGQIQQVPPAISAIKVAGQRSYRLARAGAAPALPPRAVTVWEFRVLAARPAGDLLDVDVAVRCSTGTYVRALARDLGQALGVGGHLTMLRRTRVGPYGLGVAHTLPELAADLSLVPIEQAAAAAFPSRQLSDAEAAALAHGRRLPAATAPYGTPVAPHGPGARVPPGGPVAAADPHGPAAPVTPSRGPVPPVVSDVGPVAAADPHGPGAPVTPSRGPVAAFAPDGTLVALLEERDGQARPLAVFLP